MKKHKRPWSRWLLQRALEKRFQKDFSAFRELSRHAVSRFSLDWKDRYPCLDDKTAETPFDTHYIYHTAWAARAVRENSPSEHVDISSSLYFSAILSAFIPVKFYDYRPARIRLDRFQAGTGDLLKLPFPDESVPSLSCMHVVEHVGLGRYGDPLDYDGDLKAMSELTRVLARGGHLLFVVPVGRPRIHFNAHRIYGYRQVLECFQALKLKEYALIPDAAAETGMILSAGETITDQQQYGCGCFWFTKP